MNDERGAKIDDQSDHGDEARRTTRGRRRRWLALFVAAALLVLLSPLALRRMDYFRVRRVEVVGARYVPPGALVDLLHLDSTATIWERLGPLAERVKRHPQVRDASISRRMPGTLVVRIVENLPVALISTADGLQPVDRDGRPLPIDPSRTPVDLPVIAKRDTAVLHLLDGVRASQPALFARVSEVQWDAQGGLRVFLAGVTVRAAADCTSERFAEVIPVEQDLVRRGHRVAELDLRYRNQIVARIE